MLILQYQCPSYHRIPMRFHTEGVDIAPRSCPECGKPTVVMARRATQEEEALRDG